MKQLSPEFGLERVLIHGWCAWASRRFIFATVAGETPVPFRVHWVLFAVDFPSPAP